ncbi:hypothetical protein [Chelativorans sp. M5D2P16]
MSWGRHYSGEPIADPPTHTGTRPPSFTRRP